MSISVTSPTSGAYALNSGACARPVERASTRPVVRPRGDDASRRGALGTASRTRRVRTRSTRSGRFEAAIASATRRDLPMPVSPVTTRTAWISLHRRRHGTDLRQLGVAPAKRRQLAGRSILGALASAPTSTAARSLLPLTVNGSSTRVSTVPGTLEHRRAATAHRSAAAMSRAARFTVSPMTVYVAGNRVPISPAKRGRGSHRGARAACWSASRMARAARSMRPSSSSWATGTPATRMDLAAVGVDVGCEERDRPRHRPPLDARDDLVERAGDRLARRGPRE